MSLCLKLDHLMKIGRQHTEQEREIIIEQLAKKFQSEPQDDVEQVVDAQKEEQLLKAQEIVQKESKPIQDGEHNGTHTHRVRKQHKLAQCLVDAAITFVKRTAELLINLLVGDVSKCPYGYLRSSSVTVTTIASNANFLQQYLDSGQILKNFISKTVTPRQFGQGIYRKTQATATGANGVVRLGFGSSLNIYAFFQNSWSQKSTASVCYSTSGISARDAYWAIYNKSVSQINAGKSVLSFWAGNVFCQGFDLNRTWGKIQMDYWGKWIEVNYVWKKSDISIAQTCKHIGVEIKIKN